MYWVETNGSCVCLELSSLSTMTFPNLVDLISRSVNVGW